MRHPPVAERKGLQNYAQARIAVRKAAQSPPNPIDLSGMEISSAIVELVPESVARENKVMPIDFDGETISLATHRWGDIALTDKLRFLLAKNVELVNAREHAVERAIGRHYGEDDFEMAGTLPTAVRAGRRSLPAGSTFKSCG